MTFLEPLRIITEIIQQEIENSKSKETEKMSAEAGASEAAVQFAKGVLQGAVGGLASLPWRSPAIFSPPTLKVCKTLPDLLIDSSYDPLGVLRASLDLALRVAAPAAPHRICFEVPLQELIDPLKEILETVVSAIPIVSIAQEILKETVPLRKTLLRELPSDDPFVKELREHLKTMGVLREVHFRRLPRTHPLMKELKEKLNQLKQR